MHPESDPTRERPVRRFRRENLLRLVAECGGTRNLATKTGTVDTHLIAIQKGRRSMGDDLAEKLEAGMAKPFGWLDLPPDEEATSHPTTASAAAHGS